MAGTEVGFGDAYREAGGVRRRAAAPYPLTHERIREMAEIRERLLRIQYEDERLPEEDEAAIRRLSLDDPDQCFRRYEYLLGVWGAWERGARGGGSDDDAETASELLVAREPVRVRVAGHLIPVYPRSRAALIRMARHEQARIAIGEKLDWLERRAQELDAARNAGEMSAFRAWKVRRRIAALVARASVEWEYQFRGVLANALSPTGRAALPEELPDIMAALLPPTVRKRLGARAGEWWRGITHIDERTIVQALLEHVGRYGSALRTHPKPETPKEPKQGEAEGFGVVLRIIEGRLALPPMALEDEMLFPTVHAFMLGQPGTRAREIEDAFVA